MNTCAMTRLLIPGFVVGMIVSSIAQSDLVGLGAAVVVMTALLVVQRVRGTATACAVRPPERRDRKHPSPPGVDPVSGPTGDLAQKAEAH